MTDKSPSVTFIKLQIGPLLKLFVECNTHSCPDNGFSHLRCGSQQLLWCYNGPLGCFSD